MKKLIKFLLFKLFKINKSLIQLIQSLIQLLQSLNQHLTYILNIESPMYIKKVEYYSKGRFLLYTLVNKKLEDNHKAIKSLFNTLINDEQFIKFGYRKVILVNAYFNNSYHAFHHNILINNNTTFDQYYEKIKDYIETTYDYSYSVDVIPMFKVWVWNVDMYANKNIKITKNATMIIKNKTPNNKREYHSYIEPIKP
uniref:DNA polymerase type B n=1 Tax=Amanita thiersii TaxID=235537 RepID=A0A5Q0N2K0_9AGAR|nr:DNA polymerase type B [Amanita thiersii]QFZ98735.1 DNA polymerase type B [Amanita thiersii]